MVFSVPELMTQVLASDGWSLTLVCILGDVAEYMRHVDIGTNTHDERKRHDTKVINRAYYTPILPLFKI
jgi:hypothetical protein